MSNNISFNGIKNIYVGKNVSKNFGSYITSDGLVKRGNKEITYLKLKCNLDNNALGQDLSEFRDSLKRSKCFQSKSVADTDTSGLELIVKRIFVKDNLAPVTNSNFILNGVSILPNERQILPLFTYLAKLTRNLGQNPESSEAKKACFNLMNKSIHEEAMRFIDNMY